MQLVCKMKTKKIGVKLKRSDEIFTYANFDSNVCRCLFHLCHSNEAVKM